MRGPGAVRGMGLNTYGRDAQTEMLVFHIISLVLFARTTCVCRTNSSVAMVRSSTLVLALVASAVAAPAAPAARACAWPAWKGVRHMFVLCVYGLSLSVEAGWAVSSCFVGGGADCRSGDSYTQTGFDVNGAQPSAANPFGNPTYP
jgi:hypothetical protein